MLPDALTLDFALLGMRVALAILLYLFVLRVIVALRRSLEEPPAEVVEEAVGELVVVDGTDEYEPGTAFLVEPVTRIGRTDEAEVPLHDATVSADHALVTIQRGGLYIEDRGSRNGTYVNRTRVDGPTRLRHGDVIQVGRVRLKLTR